MEHNNSKFFYLIALLFFCTSCASVKKKNTPEFSKLFGKKVALVEMQGEATARKIVEVALVNQLVKKGTFQLISKQEVENARAAADLKATDYIELAKRVSADYALSIEIKNFDAVTREHYDSIEEEDSQLTEERGKDEAKTKRYFKVKMLDAHVLIQFEFVGTQDHDLQTGVAEATDHAEASAQKEAAHLPSHLSFMEKVTQKAIRDFFD